MNMTGKLLLASAAVVAMSGGAMAADLAMPGPAPAMAAPAPGNWDGPYIGANIGYGWGFADHQPAAPIGPGGNGFDINPSGFLIGGQIGYNFHLSDVIVAGVEGSVDWSNESGSTNLIGGTTTQRINWDGNIVAKLGYDAGAFLPYIDAGVAFANSTRSNTGGPASSTNTQTGWTVGAGLEYMLADNLSAFISYNYADYGTAKYNTGGGPNQPSIHLTDSIVKVGLNWHF